MQQKIVDYNSIIDIVSLSWELSEWNIKELETLFSPLIEGDKWLVINLWEVDYLNSMIIGFLVNLKKNKDDLVIWTISPEVEELFNGIWLNNVFKIFSSEQDAISYLEKEMIA